jgi:endoglycosylceramidase
MLEKPSRPWRWSLRWAELTALVLCAATLLSSCSTTSPNTRNEGTGNTDADANANAYVGHSGRWLTDAKGDVVILHGMNMVYKRPPYTPAATGFGEIAARSLSDYGLDLVRLGVIYSAVEPKPGVFDGHYLDSIAATVSTLARHGVYTLLDFHQDQMSEAFGGEGFPSWSVQTNGLPERRYVFPLGYTESPALNAAFDNFWSDRKGPGGVGLQERYASAWRYVARRFAKEPFVVGYDLFNEPWPAGAGDVELASFYGRVIAAIRSVDRRHVIFYEPYVTFNFGAPTQLPRLGDAKVGMSFHDYCLQVTTQNETSCAASEIKTVQNALARSQSTRDTLVMTEFGASADEQDVGRVVSIADLHQLSWTEWAYCGCDDPTGSIPPTNEELVHDPRLPATARNVDTAKLETLVEPYPRTVAGTPISYNYEPSNHEFQLAYSTRAPDGHRFGSGSADCTTVIVPALQYPRGYSATVHGGHVVSSPGAGLLQIVPTPRSPGVSVTVVPTENGHTSALGVSTACPRR